MDYENLLISFGFGAEVKALPSGRISGKAVVFDSVDRVGDHFTKDSYFGKSKEVDLYWNHNRDAGVKGPLTTAYISMAHDCLIAEAQLDMTDPTHLKLWKLAQEGALNYSTGSAPHLVDRRPPNAKSGWLARWPIAEVSLCPRDEACERRAIVEVKSLAPRAHRLLDLSPAEKLASIDRELQQREISRLQGQLEGLKKCG